MLKNKEPMIVYPFSGGGYAVRPINWAGIWDENGKLKSSCNVTAVFAEEEDAKEYCQIMNEPLRMTGMILSDELNKRGDWYKTTVESLVQIIYSEYESDLDKAHEVVCEWLEKRLLPKNPMYGSLEGSFTVENNANFQNLMEILMGGIKNR